MLTLVVCCTLAACAQTDDGSPRDLDRWQQVTIVDNALTTVGSAEPFDVNTPLFTDYASKYRTRFVPGPVIERDGWYEYPDGTVFTKTFYYRKDAGTRVTIAGDGTTPDTINTATHRLIETRVLAKRAGKWSAFPYLWNDDQTEATLAALGASIELTLDDMPFTYFVPDKNQCGSCHAWNHTLGDLRPLGAKPSQFSTLPVWNDDDAPMPSRARAYLDVSCAHCHNADGAADTSGLRLDFDNTDAVSLGVCKPPVAAGRGASHQFGIVPGRPDESILVARLASTDPGIMMPELGRSLVHREGLALIRAWVSTMPGKCGMQPGLL